MLNCLFQVNWNTKICLVDPPEKALQRLLQCAKVAHQLRMERRHRVPDLDHKRITEGTLLLKDQKVIARLIGDINRNWRSDQEGYALYPGSASLQGKPYVWAHIRKCMGVIKALLDYRETFMIPLSRGNIF
jgi:hypothetical protein